MGGNEGAGWVMKVLVEWVVHAEDAFKDVNEACWVTRRLKLSGFRSCEIVREDVLSTCATAGLLDDVLEA